MKKGLIIRLSIIAVIIAFSITLNVLCTTAFDSALRQFIGETESKIDTDNASDDTSSLDKEYVKSDYEDDESFANAELNLSQAIATEGITLLKNEKNALPLDASKDTVSLWGYASYNTMYCGTGSGGNVSSSKQVNMRTGLKKAGFTINETLWNYYVKSNYSFKGKTGSTYKANSSSNYTYGKGGNGIGARNYGNDASDWTLFEIPYSTVSGDGNVVAAANGTVAIYTIMRFGGEGKDCPREMKNWLSGNSLDETTDGKKTYLQPYSVEVDMLKNLRQKYSKVIVLLNANNPMQLDEIDPYADAIIWLPGSGTAGLYGLGNLLAGKENFSGHIADTMATDSLNAPAMQNMGDFQYSGTSTPYYYMSYKEGIYVGYKYYETRYEDSVLGQGNASKADIYNTTGWKYSDQVDYPFGYGLSYTEFEWKDYSVTKKGDEFTVKVTVKNVGNVAGKDVVQVYAQAPYTKGGIEKSSVVLVDFAKTKKLAPNEEETLTLSFNQEDLKSYDYKNEKTYVLDKGTYYVAAASNAHNAVNNILKAKGATGIDGNGDASFVKTFDLNKKLYNEGADGVRITNRLSHAYDETLTVLSRSDWSGTYPTVDGTPSTIKSDDGEINGVVYTKKGSNKLFKNVNSRSSGNPYQENKDALDYSIVDGTGTSELELIDMRGRSYDDEGWDLILDKVKTSDIQTLVTYSGFYTAAITGEGAIQKPGTKEVDGPSSLTSSSTNTVYSTQIMLAMTFNKDLSYAYGRIIGNAGLKFKTNGWYAPGMNLHRTAFGGRNFEYYSEDTYLTGVMGSETIKGAASLGMYSFMKHFAINDQETNRGDAQSLGLITWIDEQTARELYLKPFEAAVKCGTVTTNYYEVDQDGNYTWAEAQTPACMAMMTSFTRLGATWMGGDFNLLTGIVRREWGFNGFILSDFQNNSYMCPEQMVFAGGDAELRNYSPWNTYDSDATGADYYFGREAVHHILYTVVNSAAMNGYVHGATFIPGFAYYNIILIAWDVIAVGLIALTLLVGKKKKSEKAAE